MNGALDHNVEKSAAAIAAGNGDAYDYMVVGLARARDGDEQAAEELLTQARTLEPTDPSPLVGLAILRRQQGRLRDAVLACDAAIALAPQYGDAWRERAGILALGGSMEASRRSYEEAARLAPDDAAAHAGLAAMAAREGAAKSAVDHAERALSLDPSNVIAASALASARLSAGDAAEVPTLLAPMLSSLPVPSSERILANSLLGDAWHQLGHYDRAFDYYVASKSDFAAIHASAQRDRLTHKGFVEAIEAGLRSLDTSDWPRTAEDNTPGASPHHVFLIGYPRSGTTLVENVIASLPDVAALEERPTMVDADRIFLAGDKAAIGNGLADFAALDELELSELRASYWRKVHASGIPSAISGFVDMDPLKATRLPLIARLFPGARILIMRRDPRDVVWSCFKTNFAMSSGTLEYTTLERAASHYDAMMRLTDLAIKKLPLNTLVVSYEKLVREFDATTRAICAFTGLPWSERVYQFDRTADRRGVSTASAAQVRRGLYDGTRQWERYAKQLEPALPILAPWIEEFGYS